MGGVTRVVSFFCCILFLLLMVACEPHNGAGATPSACASLEPATKNPTAVSLITMRPVPTPLTSPTVPATSKPITAPDYPAPDEFAPYRNMGLTKEQAEKLDVLLSGGYGMAFTSVKQLKNQNYFDFGWYIMRFYPEIVCGEMFYDIPLDDDMFRAVESKTVEKAINSAFGINYKSKIVGSLEEGFKYSKGKYLISYDGCMHPNTPFMYQSKKISSDKFQCLMDYVEFGCDGVYYSGRGVAVVQKDDKSIYGFRMISFQPGKAGSPKFPQVTASNFYEADDITYVPENVTDEEQGITSWAAKGEDIWIQLKSSKPQPVNGLILSMFSDDAEDFQVTVELSDGSKYLTDSEQSVISFGKTISTEFIILTFYNTKSINVDTILPY